MLLPIRMPFHFIWIQRLNYRAAKSSLFCLPFSGLPPASLLSAEQNTFYLNHMRSSYLCLPVGVGVCFRTSRWELPVSLMSPTLGLRYLRYSVCTLLMKCFNEHFSGRWTKYDFYPRVKTSGLLGQLYFCFYLRLPLVFSCPLLN